MSFDAFSEGNMFSLVTTWIRSSLPNVPPVKDMAIVDMHLARWPMKSSESEIINSALLEFRSRLSFTTFRLNLDECSPQSVSIALSSTAFCFRRSYLVGWSVSAVIIIHGNRFQPRWASLQSVIAGWLNRGCILCIRIDIPYRKKWWYRHGSRFTMVS